MRLAGILDPVITGRGLGDPPRCLRAVGHEVAVAEVGVVELGGGLGEVLELASVERSGGISVRGGPLRDRKSTRLNSSHVAISYAVFCLKKKKTPQRDA